MTEDSSGGADEATTTATDGDGDRHGADRNGADAGPPDAQTPTSDDGVTAGETGAQSGAAEPEQATESMVTAAARETTGDDAFDRRRTLHPLSVPYRALQQGIGVVIVIVLVGSGGVLEAIRSGDPLLAGGALLSILALVGIYLGYFVAYYRRFTYQLTPDTFDIKSGVLSRREREIPYRRIQNVDITQNVVHRALGIAEVGIETAGGGDTEAQLRYVAVDEADRLQAELSRLSRAAKADATGHDVTAPTADRFETVFGITDRELGVLALVSIDFRVASVLFFGASIFAPSFAAAAQPEVIIGPETIVEALYGPLAGIAVVIALAVLSGVISATRYYGFRLDRSPDELRYERGLLQRFRGTIPREKIQTLTIQENVLARLWGYASLYIETAGHSGSSSGEGSQSQAAIPIAKRHRVDDLAQSLESADLSSFERPPKRARLRYVFRYAGALLLLAGILYAGQQLADRHLFWYVPLALLPLVPVAAHLKWRQLGFTIDADHVVTRKGFWVRRTKVVPLHRVQTVVSTETIFQRRRHLGTVTIDTAGSRSIMGDDAQAVDIDRERLEKLREQVGDGLYASLRRRATQRRGATGGRGGGDGTIGDGTLGGD